MSFEVTAEAAPLTADHDGVMRIGSTRVTLDTIVAAFREGMTPEGIVAQYPTLNLADVYSIIGFILHHSEDVEQYLLERKNTADSVRQENEARAPSTGVRGRLLSRRGRG